MTFDIATARRLVLKVLASKNPSVNIDRQMLDTEVGTLYGRERGQTTPGHSRDWRTCLGIDGEAMVEEVIWDCIVQRILTFVRSGSFVTEVDGLRNGSPKGAAVVSL